jgi:hypothetical protein
MSHFRLTIWDSLARAQEEIKAAILSFKTRQEKSAEPIIGKTRAPEDVHPCRVKPSA